MSHQNELMAMVSSLMDQVGTLSEQVMNSLIVSHGSRQETNNRLASIEQQLLTGHHRMNDIERQQQAGTCVGIKTFLKQVASPKEWVIGTGIVLLLLTGVVSPKEIKTYFFGIQEQK